METGAIDPAREPTAFVHSILRGELGLLTESQLAPNAMLQHDLDCDPLDRVGLAMAIEDSTGSDVDESAIDEATAVADLVQLVVNTCEAAAARARANSPPPAF